jgi:twitching motility protein PilT
VFRTIPSKILTLKTAQRPQDRRPGPEAARPGAGDRPDRLGQVHHAGGHGQPLNENEYGHILTIEDPIEFVHESKKCLINQREVAAHAVVQQRAALGAARRPGRDPGRRNARPGNHPPGLTAAETGHLVFGTLHTSSAAKTIDRIVDVFPADEKEMVRAMLSESLQAVISQTLLQDQGRPGPRGRARDHGGHPAIRNLIREAKVAQMYSAIQTGRTWACRPWTRT